MIKVFGSHMCPDCIACKANFDHYGIEHDFIDINESLMNLKEFLSCRDSEPVFDRLKAIGDIGLPACIDEDGKVFTDWEGYLKGRGMEPIDSCPGKACSLDRKGC